MFFIAQFIAATGLAVVTVSSRVIRWSVRTFFIPAGRHRGVSSKSD
jgi:hypothetical protein